MKRLSFVFLVFAMLVAVMSGSAAAVSTKTMTVSLRIEGVSANIYFNETLTVNYEAETLTVTDVIRSISGTSGAPNITLGNNSTGTYISTINGVTKYTYGVSDGWMLRINSESITTGIDSRTVAEGDEMVIYYSDEHGAGMQYPEVDLSRMLSDGIVRFTGQDTSQPIVGATVMWDGMEYITDSKGEIIIDSTGAGVPHYLQIERYDARGVPTVLRFAPGYSVVYIFSYFSDVAPASWYYDAVMFVVDNGLFNGTSETKFSPSAAMNRAMFVTVLGRMAGVSVDQSASTDFSDVVNDGWSTGYISWASENGIVTGYSDGTFGQYKGITREQIATILYRYADKYGYTLSDPVSLSAYSDAEKVSDYAKTAMGWAVGAGIINGMGNNTLNPSGTATRAEVATMLERFIGSLEH